MLYNIIKTIVRLCFSYALLILSIIWLSMANYYYLTQQFQECTAAFITGGTLFILGSAVGLLNLYFRKKAGNQNKFNNVIPNAISSLLPIAAKTFISNAINKKSTKVVAISMLALIPICYFILKKKHTINQFS